MRSISAREAIRAFERAGYRADRTSGSHHVLKKPGEPGTLSVPVHRNRDLKPGTLRGLIRSSGLTVDQFWGFVDQ